MPPASPTSAQQFKVRQINVWRLLIPPCVASHFEYAYRQEEDLIVYWYSQSTWSLTQQLFKQVCVRQKYTIRSTELIIRGDVPTIQDLYRSSQGVRERTTSISAECTHPKHKLLRLLSLGPCYMVLFSKTSCHRNSLAALLTNNHTQILQRAVCVCANSRYKFVTFLTIHFTWAQTHIITIMSGLRGKHPLLFGWYLLAQVKRFLPSLAPPCGPLLRCRQEWFVGWRWAISLSHYKVHQPVTGRNEYCIALMVSMKLFPLHAWLTVIPNILLCLKSLWWR